MISKKAANIVPSISGELSTRADTMIKSGVDIVKLTAGEPDFAPPENVMLAAAAAVRGKTSKYPPNQGYIELREAIAAKLERDNGIKYKASEICVSTGAKQAVLESLMAVCDDGDEVIIPTPCWVSYGEMAKLAGAVPVFVPCSAETGFALDLNGIERAVTQRTKAIILCSPNNPSGAVYSREAILEVLSLANKHNFYVISDEIYEKLTYGGVKCFSPASVSDEARERCVTINGFSKAYAMPGWRLGYSAAPSEVASAIKAIQSHMTSAANGISQMAAIEALNGPQDSVEAMRAEYEQRRDFCFDKLRRIPGIEILKPQGAFYMFPKVSAYFGRSFGTRRIDSSQALAEYLLDEAKLAVVFGTAYEMEGYLRLSYAASMETLREAMARLAGALEKLK